MVLVLLWPLLLCGGCPYTVEEHDLFYPRRVSTKYWRNQRPVDGVQIKPVEIHADGAALRGWLFTPPRVRRHMVHFYGTGEVAAADSVVMRLVYLARQLECEILVMDYRGYGFTAGSPTFENIQADAARMERLVVRLLELAREANPDVHLGRVTTKGVVKDFSRMLPASWMN